MNETYTTLAPLARIVVETLQSYGIDAEELMRAEKFDMSVLDDPNRRFSGESMRRVVARGVELSGDPALGLRAAENFRPGSAHALGLAWFTSSSLRDALGRLDRYGRFITTAVTIRFDDEASNPRILIEDQIENENRPEAIDAVFGILIRLGRTAAGESFTPLRCEMKRPRPAETDRFLDYFKCEIGFGAQCNCIYLKSEDLDQPLLGANTALASECDQIIEKYLASFDREDYASRVRVSITKLLPAGGISEKLVAQSLNVSPRTLQRKLRQQGTSYQQALNETRYELAVQHLQHAAYSVTEIAYLLGYENTGNFTRAFKSWAGETPTQFRGKK